MAGKPRPPLSQTLAEPAIAPPVFPDFRRFNGLLEGPFVPKSWARYRLSATFEDRPGTLFVGLPGCAPPENQQCWLEAALLSPKADTPTWLRLRIDGQKGRIVSVETLGDSCKFQAQPGESDENGGWRSAPMDRSPSFFAPSLPTPLGRIPVVWRKIEIDTTPTYLAENAQVLPIHLVKAVAPYQTVELSEAGLDWPAKRQSVFALHPCRERLSAAVWPVLDSPKAVPLPAPSPRP